MKDLVESAAVLNASPKVYLIVVSIAHFQDLSIELSAEVKESLLTVVENVNKIINSISIILH